jgi:phage baseplate assembly protein W
MADEPAGIAFPFRIDAVTGRVATSSGPDKLRGNLEHLLLTRIGERMMAREYGSGVTELLHENVIDALATVAEHQIARAIVQFEPRVLPQDVTVLRRGAQVFVRVTYADAGDSGSRTVVLPVS